jgi:hypothetical protein
MSPTTLAGGGALRAGVSQPKETPWYADGDHRQRARLSAGAIPVWIADGSRQVVQFTGPLPRRVCLHPGHLDAAVSGGELARRADHLRQHYLGPLRLGGALLVLDTNGPVEGPELVSQVAVLLRG